MRFEYPDDLDPAWNPRLPEFAYAANSVSLLMPYAEPYFVTSVRSAIPSLAPELAAPTLDYVRQEAQHHRQHRRFNDILVRQYPRLARLERWIGRTYGWLSRTRSQRFNLAFAAGSETIAYALARWSEDHLTDLFAGADPIPATLFLWHLAEEVEHKSAAFDVYEAIDGSRLRYAAAMLLSLVLLMALSAAGILTMLVADRRALNPLRYFRLLRLAVGFAFTGLQTMVVSALPGHHPSSFSDPIWLSTWLTHFDPVTATLPEPTFLRA